MFAILALAPATLLMGATLPTLTRYLTLGGRGIAGAFQRLYTANTVGAIVGTALAGFVLIELLGLTGALLVGAVCSGTAGLVALRARPADPRCARRRPAVRARADRRRVARADPAPRPPGERSRRLALTIAFISGLTSLGYQVVWNRLIGAGTGSSTYVFTTILVLFLIGIAIGAALLGVLRPRVRSHDRC